MYQIRTVRGYDLYEVVSALQKAIRRGDKKIAGYFALELFASGYDNYCWKRLLTISAEDVETWITKEILSLHFSFELINKGAKEKKGRIFISKAVVILCDAIKSRDTDHLQNLVYDKKISLTDSQIEEMLEQVRSVDLKLPDYTFDIHTRRGKMMGKTKKDFFLEEENSLFPKSEFCEFDSQLKTYIDEL